MQIKLSDLNNPQSTYALRYNTSILYRQSNSLDVASMPNLLL